MPQRLAGEVTELGMVTLGLEFGDDHHGQHDVMFCEPAERGRISQQDACVKDIGPPLPWGDASRASRATLMMRRRTGRRTGHSFSLGRPGATLRHRGWMDRGWTRTTGRTPALLPPRRRPWTRSSRMPGPSRTGGWTPPVLSDGTRTPHRTGSTWRSRIPCHISGRGLVVAWQWPGYGRRRIRAAWAAGTYAP